MLGDEMSEINFDLEATRRCLTLVTMQKKKKERKKKRQCNLLETEVHLDSGKHRVYSLRV